MGLRVYNTLTRQKEEFKPRDRNRVNMFVCGQTTYDDAHLGHAKTYVAFDVVTRWLKHEGYSVFYVQNITDVNPKIDQRARELEASPQELAEKYTKRFLEDMKELKVKQNVNLFPKSSDYIPEMIEQVKTLLKKGYAYEVEGNVYFRVDQFENYTKLSNQKLEELKKRHRIEPDPRKQSPLDFALWKKKTEDWRWTFESPWGEGIPGWHIEDTAMTITIFGPQYDLHGGAKELMFPHHTNEIAQAEAITGKCPFVKYWLHSGVFKVGGRQMSKSLRNFITIREVLKRHSPEAIRLYLLSTHYRNPIDYQGESMKEFREKIEENLDEAERNLSRLYKSLNRIKELPTTTKKMGESLERLSQKTRNEFSQAMDDDFNTPKAIGILHEFAGQVNKFVDGYNWINKQAKREVIQTFLELGEILGILQEGSNGEKREDLISLIIDIREVLRRKEHYEIADKIRKRLKEIGIRIEDTEEGPRWVEIE